MAWGQGRSSRLMGELLGMLLDGKPATWQSRNKPSRPTNQSGETLAMVGTVDLVASTTLAEEQSAS
eukprot:2700289-Amphidinium_carterae.1